MFTRRRRKSTRFNPLRNFESLENRTMLAGDGLLGSGGLGSDPVLTGGEQLSSHAGLILALGMDEGTGSTTADASGLGNDGTVSGATWTTGKYGSALTFDGVDDWVTIPDDNSLDVTTGITLSAWVRPTQLFDWHTVIFKERNFGLEYALYAHGDTETPSGWVNAVNDFNVDGPNALPLNTWTYLATTYDNTDLNLYVDGLLVATVPLTGNMPGSTGPLRIGGNDIWGEFFVGEIDEVRIYDHALTVTEIQQDMSEPITPANQPPTVTLTPVVSELDEDADTSSPIIVANITVNDDGQGTNNLSLSGDDAALFEIAGTDLRLIAGAMLDFETNPTLDVTVNVDDPTIPGDPDDFATHAVTINDIVEGPNIPEDIVGFNTGEEFWVGESNGTTLDTSYYGDWPSTTSYEIIGVGDVNGDGLDDVVGRSNDTGTIRVAISTGASSFNSSDWGNFTTITTWSNMFVGDFTGDGLADVLGRADSDGTFWLGQSTGSGFVNSYWGRFTPTVAWPTMLALDLNGDGRQDITARAQDGTWWSGISTGSALLNSYWGKWSTNVTWDDISVGDFNGDGLDDVAGRGNGSFWWVSQSTGTYYLTQYWATWTSTVTWEDVTVGDYNADGKDDIAGRANGQWWIAISNGAGFSNEYWGYWTTSTTWSDVLRIDINGDHRDDLIGRAANGQWWIFQSTGSNFTGVLVGHLVTRSHVDECQRR